MVEKHKISLFYTAPTAIRALMKYGDAPVLKYDLSSLRVLGE
jgi:acetyl-CoA synthetase